MGVAGHPHGGQGGWLSYPAFFFVFFFVIFFILIIFLIF